jgi:6-phosphogluconate dehydrogenase
MEIPMEIGIIGLGRMGGNIARQALEKGIHVIGYSQEKVDSDLLKMGLVNVKSIKKLKEHLTAPRVIFIYIPSGPSLDRLIYRLSVILDKEDIIIDGGNSYWGDSIRRAQRIKEKGLYLVDLGTSGGIEGVRHGACFMAGGEDTAVRRIEPLIIKLAADGGYVHAGPSGSGHFVKLVHNGIEYGIIQAIAEGINLLKNYHKKLDIEEILDCWKNGSVIRSWLLDIMEQQYRKEGGLESIPSHIEDTGEVNWLVADALQMEIPIPVISLSVMQLFTSRDGKQNWARAIAMMRNGFGGYPFGEDESIARERQHGRTGDIYRGNREKKQK